LDTKTSILPEGKKVYFASDFHLGVPNYEESKQRELKIVSWLRSIKKDCAELILLGDIFDFWFEYKYAIPKGFLHLQSELLRFTEEGIPVTFFTGNHDMWMKDYFTKELGVTVRTEPLSVKWNDTKFYLHHGDGLGPGDRGYKFIKGVFANRFFQWCFRWVHPDIGIGVANYFSGESGKTSREKDKLFLGAEKEWLILFCEEETQSNAHNYFVFGHRHYPLVHKLNNSGTYVNLGDWLSSFTYGVFDGENFALESFTS
jgi:UDP-2,3-diacylglucosamine hydrolase